MKFRYQLRYILIRLLKCSHAEADNLCRSGAITIDGQLEPNPRRMMGMNEEIRLKEVVIRERIQHRYLAFYKPNLYECTSNRNIGNNLYELLPEQYQDLFSLGRLDKNSEGLLMLTNDGRFYKEMMQSDSAIDKEYLVTTYHPVTAELERAFTEPFLLGQRWTKPARFEVVSSYGFKVVLQEGINRQIRRICAKSNNQVKQLVRVRFGPFTLDGLLPGEYREIDVSRHLADFEIPFTKNYPFKP